MDIYTCLKVIVIGDSGTGKSCLTLRFVNDEFSSNQMATIGLDMKSKVIEIDDKRVKIVIWDTAGAEHFRCVTTSYYRGAQGVIFVYDVSVRSSFARLNSWIDDMNLHATKSNFVRMLVANKVDLVNREVSAEEGRRFAQKHRMLFIEASAKTSEGVQDAFTELVHKVLQTPGLWTRYGADSDIIRPNETDQIDQSSCWIGAAWGWIVSWFV